jgi:hypothetical protein
MTNTTTAANMTGTQTEQMEGIVVKRFLRRVNSRYRGLSRRGLVKQQYGTFYRAAIVVRLDDGRYVQGYLSEAYDSPEAVKAKATRAPHVGDRLRLTCDVHQRTVGCANGFRATSTYYPNTTRGHITFTNLTRHF